MKHAGLIVAAATMLVASGCAVAPKVQQEQAVADLSRYQAVRVSIEAPEQIRGQTGYDTTAAELRERFVANLKAKGKYSIVGTGTATDPDLDVRLAITDFHYVHGAARFLTGILSGHAVLSVTMTITDGKSGAALGSVDAGDSSSHAQGILGATTSRQVEAIANELAGKI